MPRRTLALTPQLSERTEGQRMKMLLARHRSLEIVARWLVVILVAWAAVLIGPAAWRPGGWLVLAAGFGRLAVLDLPYRRQTRRALEWCVIASLWPAMADLFPAEPLVHARGPLAVALLTSAAIAISVFAFGAIVRDLGRLGGSPTTTDQWRSILRWQLVGVAATGLSLLAWPQPLGVLRGHDWSILQTMGPSVLLATILLSLVLMTVFVIRPAMIVVQLSRHLRARYGLWSMIERGELVRRAPELDADAEDLPTLEERPLNPASRTSPSSVGYHALCNTAR